MSELSEAPIRYSGSELYDWTPEAMRDLREALQLTQREFGIILYDSAPSTARSNVAQIESGKREAGSALRMHLNHIAIQTPEFAKSHQAKHRLNEDNLVEVIKRETKSIGKREFFGGYMKDGNANYEDARLALKDLNGFGTRTVEEFEGLTNQHLARYAEDKGPVPMILGVRALMMMENLDKALEVIGSFAGPIPRSTELKLIEALGEKKVRRALQKHNIESSYL